MNKNNIAVISIIFILIQTGYISGMNIVKRSLLRKKKNYTHKNRSYTKNKNKYYYDENDPNYQRYLEINKQYKNKQYGKIEWYLLFHMTGLIALVDYIKNERYIMSDKTKDDILNTEIGKELLQMIMLSMKPYVATECYKQLIFNQNTINAKTSSYARILSKDIVSGKLSIDDPVFQAIVPEINAVQKTASDHALFIGAMASPLANPIVATAIRLGIMRTFLLITPVTFIPLECLSLCSNKKPLIDKVSDSIIFVRNFEKDHPDAKNYLERYMVHYQADVIEGGGFYNYSTDFGKELVRHEIPVLLSDNIKEQIPNFLNEIAIREKEIKKLQ